MGATRDFPPNQGKGAWSALRFKSKTGKSSASIPALNANACHQIALLGLVFHHLTTAVTLNRHGITHIESSRQAAEALRPLAGRFAATLYTIGILGVGLLAIPTLTGSAAYALAETLGWREGSNERFGDAKYFYGVVMLSTVARVALDFAKISPVCALLLTAVINGLLAPILLIGILAAASDRKLMQGQPSSRLSRIVPGVTVVVVIAAAVGMFVF